MRSVEVAGHPKGDARATGGRWTSWWSTRGETIELFFYTVLVPVDLLAVLAAFATAMQIPAEAATRHARVSRMLQEFGAALRATAPGSATVQTWTEHTATWRTTA